VGSDQTFRLGVLVGGGVAVVLIAVLRFCGSVTLPPKSAAPTGPTGTAKQLVTQASAQTPVYEQFLREDAAAAMLPVPTLDEMSRKLPHRLDDSMHPLKIGEPIELAGLRLKLEASAETLTLHIENLAPNAVAYHVDTDTGLGTVCNSARVLPFDAMVLQKGGSETRVECVYRDDIHLRVTRVEAIDLTPLEAYFVDHVSPALVGIEPRIARGHRPQGDTCANTQSQAVRSGLENKEITWGDLIDFYARHNCQRYQFPPSYRAFRSDGERVLPAIDPGM
jgi:hypothetical protein